MLSVALVALSFVAAFIAYPYMPARMASHWGMDGEVDGYMARDAGTFFVPVLTAAIAALMHVLPSFDPKKGNYIHFQKEYDELVVVLVAFMDYVYLLSLAFNLGYSFNLLQFMAPAFGVLFLYAGAILAKAKQNWFVGIKTPWTLSSEKVWDRTHALGSKLFMAAGAVAFLGVLVPRMFVASVVIVVAAAAATFVYSYAEYQKEMKAKKGKAGLAGKGAKGKQRPQGRGKQQANR